MVGFWFNAFGLVGAIRFGLWLAIRLGFGVGVRFCIGVRLVGAVWIGLRLCISVCLGLRFPVVDVRLCVGLWRIERLQRFFGGVRFRIRFRFLVQLWSRFVPRLRPRTWR